TAGATPGAPTANSTQLAGGAYPGSLPSPYGGTYADPATASTANNNIALPNSVTGAMTNATGSATSYGAFPGSETLPNIAGQASTASAVSPSPAYPPSSASGGASTGALFSGLPALPASGGSLAGYPSAPGGNAGQA